MKDLLPELKSIQSEESSSLENEDDDKEPLTKSFLSISSHISSSSDFFTQINDLQHSIATLKEKVYEIKKKHSSVLSSSEVKKRDKKELQKLVFGAEQMIREIKTGLEDLKLNIREQETRNMGNFAEIRIKKNQYAALSKELMDIMCDFNIIQSKYSINVVDSAETETNHSNLSTPSSQGMQSMISSDGLGEMQFRRKYVYDFENKVRDMHNLFIDAHFFFGFQSELSDSIERNVEETITHVEHGLLDTKKSLHYQTQARRKKIFVILICTAIIAVVLIPTLVKLIPH